MGKIRNLINPDNGVDVDVDADNPLFEDIMIKARESRSIGW